MKGIQNFTGQLDVACVMINQMGIRDSARMLVVIISSFYGFAYERGTLKCWGLHVPWLPRGVFCVRQQCGVNFFIFFVQKAVCKGIRYKILKPSVKSLPTVHMLLLFRHLSSRQCSV